MTFGYIKPLLDFSMNDEIQFEQYGELPDDLQMKQTAKILEENMLYYIKKEPDSKNSVPKAIFATFGYKYCIFVLGKLILTVLECAIPVLLKEFMSYMEAEEPAEHQTTMWAVKIALALLFIKVIKHTLWENLCYKMILTGIRAHGALKDILFAKTFRMSNASNKDYSSGEIMGLIHRDAGRVWTFVWELGDIVQTPFELAVSAYFLWTNLGWCSF